MRFPLLLLSTLLGACAGTSVSLGLPVPIPEGWVDGALVQDYEANGALPVTKTGIANQSGFFGRIEGPSGIPVVSPVSFLLEAAPMAGIELGSDGATGSLEGMRLSFGGRAYVNGRTGLHASRPCGAFFDALLNVYTGFEFAEIGGAPANEVGNYDAGYSFSIGPGWKYLFDQVHGSPVFFDVRAMYETTLTPIEYTWPGTTDTDDLSLSGVSISASVGFVF